MGTKRSGGSKDQLRKRVTASLEGQPAMAMKEQSTKQTSSGTIPEVVQHQAAEEARREAVRQTPHPFEGDVKRYAGLQGIGAYEDYLESQIAEAVRQDALRKKREGQGPVARPMASEPKHRLRDVVRVAPQYVDTLATGKEGVVFAEPIYTAAGQREYPIWIYERGEAYCVPEEHLEPTGRVDERTVKKSVTARDPRRA